MRKIREETLSQGQQPVPGELQGVAKPRIAEVLRALNLETQDRVDAVFALLDDRMASWFSAAPIGAKFCNGATVAHLACHIGILQRGNVKLDREGSDYWIKPLREIGAVEPIFLDPKTRTFLPGHPVAKSPNSAYRLSGEFRRILQASTAEGKHLVGEWIKEEKVRERRPFRRHRPRRPGAKWTRRT